MGTTGSGCCCHSLILRPTPASDPDHMALTTDQRPHCSGIEKRRPGRRVAGSTHRRSTPSAPSSASTAPGPATRARIHGCRGRSRSDPPMCYLLLTAASKKGRQRRGGEGGDGGEGGEAATAARVRRQRRRV
uniref:Uncharacterized protein n=1 Tax=Triticum urartu TaxID=4572 RepID=A0A8R7P9Z1_TRIUA